MPTTSYHHEGTTVVETFGSDVMYVGTVWSEEYAERIAEALNDAIEYPWAGDGPSVEEAGGETILFREGKNLRLASWSGDSYWRWVDERDKKVRGGPYGATGWRPMPKATHPAAGE